MGTKENENTTNTKQPKSTNWMLESRQLKVRRFSWFEPRYSRRHEEKLRGSYRDAPDKDKYLLGCVEAFLSGCARTGKKYPPLPADAACADVYVDKSGLPLTVTIWSRSFPVIPVHEKIPEFGEGEEEVEAEAEAEEETEAEPEPNTAEAKAREQDVLIGDLREQTNILQADILAKRRAFLAYQRSAGELASDLVEKLEEEKKKNKRMQESHTAILRERDARHKEEDDRLCGELNRRIAQVNELTSERRSLQLRRDNQAKTIGDLRERIAQLKADMLAKQRSHSEFRCLMAEVVADLQGKLDKKKEERERFQWDFDKLSEWNAELRSKLDFIRKAARIDVGDRVSTSQGKGDVLLVGAINGVSRVFVAVEQAFLSSQGLGMWFDVEKVTLIEKCKPKSTPKSTLKPTPAFVGGDRVNTPLGPGTVATAPGGMSVNLDKHCAGKAHHYLDGNTHWFHPKDVTSIENFAPGDEVIDEHGDKFVVFRHGGVPTRSTFSNDVVRVCPADEFKADGSKPETFCLPADTLTLVEKESKDESPAKPTPASAASDPKSPIDLTNMKIGDEVITDFGPMGFACAAARTGPRGADKKSIAFISVTMEFREKAKNTESAAGRIVEEALAASAKSKGCGG